MNDSDVLFAIHIHAQFGDKIMLSSCLLVTMMTGFLVPLDICLPNVLRRVHNHSWQVALPVCHLRHPKPEAALVTNSKSTSIAKKTSNKKRGSSDKAVTAKSSVTKPTVATQRLPRYFGKLALDEEQVTDIRQLQSDYTQRLKKLRRQLTALEKERNDAFENVLNRKQKRELKRLQGI